MSISRVRVRNLFPRVSIHNRDPRLTHFFLLAQRLISSYFYNFITIAPVLRYLSKIMEIFVIISQSCAKYYELSEKVSRDIVAVLVCNYIKTRVASHS